LLYGKDRWAFISTKDGQSTEREWHVKAIQRESVVRGVPFLTIATHMYAKDAAVR